MGEGLRFPDGSGRELAAFLGDAPAHAVVDLAPGRFPGALVLTRPLVLRGAGDLTRLNAGGAGTVITVRLNEPGVVVLESLLLEHGDSANGGGLTVEQGEVRLRNFHVQHCRADRGAGGALRVAGGSVSAELVRLHDVAADRGGAVWVGGGGVLALRDAEIRRSEARLGGALAVEGGGAVVLEGVTIGRARATTQAGGQAIWVLGARGAVPKLALQRVRLEDVPLGKPVVIDLEHPAQVRVRMSDLPRVVQRTPGIHDDGENRWR